MINDTVQAVCANGHKMTLYSSMPMMVKPGEMLRWYGSPFHCHCGARAYGPTK